MSSARRGGRGQARGAFQNGSQNGDERTGRRDSRPKRGASSAPTAAPSGPRNSSKPFRGGQKNNRQQPSARSSTPTSQTNSFQGTRVNSAGEGDNWAQRYKTLKKNREQERRDAIANGFLADPDKPRRLADAITPVGTCQDMCAEFERVERVVQKDVWPPEYDPESLGNGPTNRVPAEHRMVKKFRRAAAGLEEQLPSDLRPPLVLQKTCDYLFNSVLAEAPLGSVHYFIWDRTRAIRNDFSIQQVSRISDVRIAIECFERIVRFHILSLHQLALPKEKFENYDWNQDWEQMDKTLLSLMLYYDDNRKHYRSPYEAEFRAYQIIFCLKNKVAHLEDSVQCWPAYIREDSRVKRALKIYKAGTNITDEHGPLRPHRKHSIARENWEGFWELIRSNEVSYLMACAAETSFGLIRHIAINAIFNAYRQGGNTRTEDWTLSELVNVLGFDEEEEAREFCQHYGFTIAQRVDGTHFLDLTSVRGKTLFSPSSDLPKQLLSYSNVEFKRQGRTLSAVISGLSVLEAQKTGAIEETEESDINSPMSKTESLFVTGNSDDEGESQTNGATATATPATAEPSMNPFAKPFQPSGLLPSAASSAAAPSPFAGLTNFGKPSTPSPNPPISSSSPVSENSVANIKTSNNLNPFAPPTSGSAPTGLFTQKPSASPFTSSGLPSTTSLSATPRLSFGQPSYPSTKNPPAGSPSSVSMELPSQPAASTTSKSHSSATTTPSILTSQPQSPFKFPATTSPLGSNQTQKPGVFDPTKHTIRFAQPTSSPLFSAPTSSLGTGAKEPTTNFTDKDKGKEGTQTPAPASAPTSQPAQNPFGLPTVSSGSTKPSWNFSTPTSTQSTNNLQQAPALPSFTPPSALSASLSNEPPKFNFATSNVTPSAPQISSTSVLGQVPQAPQAAPQPTVSTAAQIQKLGPSQIIPPKPTAPTSQSQPPQPLQKEREKAKALDSLAEQMVKDPKAGILQQYIEYTASNMILEVQRELEAERDREQADYFRQLNLARRYGRRWHQIAWSLKIKRHGRERRARIKAGQAALVAAQAGTDGQVNANVTAFTNSFNSSTNSLRSSITQRPDVATELTEKIRKSRNRVSEDQLPQRDANALQTQKARLQVSKATSWTNSHRRSRTQPEAKSQTTNTTEKAAQLNGSVSNRALRNGYSFLSGESLFGHSVNAPTTRISTTQTDYFRLKAMGIDPESLRTNTSSRKRSRTTDDDCEVEAITATVSEENSPDHKRFQTTHIQRASPPPPAFAPSRSVGSHATTDEERFARYRAVKEALNRSTTPSRALAITTGADIAAAPSSAARSANGSNSDVLSSVKQIYQAFDETEEFYHEVALELKQSHSKSRQGSVKGNPENGTKNGQLRPSHGHTNGVQKSVKAAKDTPRPAYWGRVSRFVPRELYGKGAAALRSSIGSGKGKERMQDDFSEALDHGQHRSGNNVDEFELEEDDDEQDTESSASPRPQHEAQVMSQWTDAFAPLKGGTSVEDAIEL